MAETDKEKLLHQLEAHINLLKLVIEDKDAQERFKQLLLREVQFNELLLNLEKEKVPEGTETFGEVVQQKLKLSWKDWIAKVFKKLNSLLSSLVPGGGD